MYNEKRDTISVSLPKNSKYILKEMSKARRITTSKLIEFLITGKEKINPDEWTQWENWYKMKITGKEKINQDEWKQWENWFKTEGEKK